MKFAMHRVDLGRAAPVITLVAGALRSLSPSPAAADNVLAGYDLLKTDPATTREDFGSTPLPAGFFGPGSDPFTGVVYFQGNPAGSSSHCPLEYETLVDTILRRHSDAVLPVIPSSDTVPIEIVELSLISVNPLVITYNGGLFPESWELRVGLSIAAPSVGTMTLQHTNPGGGTFDSVLQLRPLFLFRRLSDSMTRFLDTGATGWFPPLTLQAAGVLWTHHNPPPGSCTSNFCASPFVASGPLGAHGVVAICPPIVVSGVELFATPRSWGTAKSTYR